MQLLQWEEQFLSFTNNSCVLLWSVIPAWSTSGCWQQGNTGTVTSHVIVSVSVSLVSAVGSEVTGTLTSHFSSQCFVAVSCWQFGNTNSDIWHPIPIQCQCFLGVCYRQRGQWSLSTLQVHCLYMSIIATEYFLGILYVQANGHWVFYRYIICTGNNDHRVLYPCIICTGKWSLSTLQVYYLYRY